MSGRYRKWGRNLAAVCEKADHLVWIVLLLGLRSLLVRMARDCDSSPVPVSLAPGPLAVIQPCAIPQEKIGICRTAYPHDARDHLNVSVSMFPETPALE